MTADEIRRVAGWKITPVKPWNWFGRTARIQAFYLCEIAAQLAELNERLKPLEIRDHTFEYPEGRP